MNRWLMAGAALAVGGMLWLGTMRGSPALDSIFQRGAGTPPAVDAAGSSSRQQAPTPRRVAAVRLPAMDPDGPRPLSLTRPMLERAWEARELPVVLPGGQAYRVVLESQRIDPGGHWTLVGRVQTRIGRQAMVVTVGPDAIFGVLPRPDGSLLQITTTRGVTAISPAGGMLPPGTTDPQAAADYIVASVPRDVDDARGRATRRLESQALDTASEVEITVLALYGDDLVELRGSVSAAETEVTNLFAISNQTYVDSGIRIRLAMAGIERIAIDPALDNNSALDAVTDNTVPGVDILQMRDAAAADLVTLVRPHLEDAWTCGVAWLNGANQSPQALTDHYAVSVVNVAPCGPYVMAHELSHNMGSAHDRQTDSMSGRLQYGAYPYSFGYRQDGPPAFATVMAYAIEHAWLGRFSDPGSNACGAACGVEGREDNVRSLNQVAPVIAAFRGPPGTLSITDAEINESEPGGSASLVFNVRLSGAAPAGGVSFAVEVVDGTAQQGLDYLAPAAAVHEIAEGERNAYVYVDVVGDTEKEVDETFLVRLVDVEGAAVHDAEAIGTIINDDPRLTISGRIRFEEGVAPPDAPFWMWVTEQSGFNHTELVELSPPDFEYEVRVVKDATLEFNMEPPPPFAILPFTLEGVNKSRVRDIELRKGLHVSGRVKLPAGASSLVDPLSLDIRASIDSVYQSLPYTELKAPDFSYSHWVVPGAWLYLSVTPPAPYTRFFAVDTDLQADVVQDIQLSTLPALVVWGGGRITEGPPDTHGSLGFIVELSAPAPAGGVQLRYRTEDGTATAGQDYRAVSGSLEIAEGEKVAYPDSIDWFGDATVEGDETFFIVLSDIVGANPVVTRQSVTLYERNPRMSDPLPPQTR